MLFRKKKIDANGQHLMNSVFAMLFDKIRYQIELLTHKVYNWQFHTYCINMIGKTIVIQRVKGVKQPPFMLRSSKCCSVSSLTVIEYSRD